MSATATANTFRIGLIGLVVTAAAVLTANNYDKVAYLGTHREYRAQFAEAAGLKSGSPVEVAGVQVGKVSSLELDGTTVLVRFSADGVRLGTETEAAIKTHTVLGSKMLELRPRGRTPLGPNATIDTAHTSTPYLLTDTLGDLTATISGLKTDDLTAALQVLGDTLNMAQPNLGAALDGVSRLSTSIGTRDDLLKDLLSNASAVTGVLSKRSAQLNALILDGNVLFQALDERRQALSVLLTNISAVSTQLTGLIADNREQLGPVLDRLNRVADLLDKRKADIERTLLPLSQYALSLGESVASGPFFKAYVGNLLPGQFLQPFIDAAFAEQGVNPGILGGPHGGGATGPPGPVPPADPGPAPAAPAPPAAPPFPPIPTIPGLPPIPGLGGQR
ncbi:MCE family protein [Nocardia jinanensis]|uniref:Mce family protein Mce3C n=1 Tax=Nocardia jinanensis TaxID=382504 RepID=A0A917VSF1_9NOCA|nr:MCE family protein [Nocardia jinanensis]GGL13168.1 Mce family protein Mce3C [Nocardia jinanensis]